MCRLSRIIVLAFLLLSVSASYTLAEKVPQKALQFAPMVKSVIDLHWRDMPLRESVGGQIEQESRWNDKAVLKTDRELGRGLAQMTITKNFNIYKEAVKYKPLRDWNWEADPYNPQRQVTFMVLQDMGNFNTVKKMFSSDEDRWAGALVAYNAGLGTVLKRRAVALKTIPDRSSKWFGGLDGVRLSYESRLLYGRNLGEMRNDYPRLILKVRSPKYKGLFAGEK